MKIKIALAASADAILVSFLFLKRIYIQDYGSFLDMALRNPRYLINIGSDTPAIVVEGFRYNAMHLAAKVGNLDVAKYILHFICDSEALLTLYGL